MASCLHLSRMCCTPSFSLAVDSSPDIDKAKDNTGDDINCVMRIKGCALESVCKVDNQDWKLSLNVM